MSCWRGHFPVAELRQSFSSPPEWVPTHNRTLPLLTLCLSGSVFLIFTEFVFVFLLLVLAWQLMYSPFLAMVVENLVLQSVSPFGFIVILTTWPLVISVDRWQWSSHFWVRNNGKSSLLVFVHLGLKTINNFHVPLRRISLWDLGLVKFCVYFWPVVETVGQKPISLDVSVYPHVYEPTVKKVLTSWWMSVKYIRFLCLLNQRSPILILL